LFLKVSFEELISDNEKITAMVDQMVQMAANDKMVERELHTIYSRFTFEYIVRVAGPDLAKLFYHKNKRCRKRNQMRLTQAGHHRV